MALIGMIVFGVAEVIGALWMGRLVDNFGARKCVIFNIITIILMTGATLLSISMARYNWNTFLMTFMWGIQDSFFNIHAFKILGSEFTNHSEPFGVEQLLQGISVFIQ